MRRARFALCLLLLVGLNALALGQAEKPAFDRAIDAYDSGNFTEAKRLFLQARRQ